MTECDDTASGDGSKKEKRKAPMGSCVWCVTITDFTDDYKARGGDWSCFKTKLYWEKDAAEKKAKKLKVQTILNDDAHGLGGGGEWNEEIFGKLLPKEIAEFFRNSSKFWDAKDMKFAEKEIKWKKALTHAECLLFEISDAEFETIYEEIIRGEFVPARERIEVEKLNVK